MKLKSSKKLQNLLLFFICIMTALFVSLAFIYITKSKEVPVHTKYVVEWESNKSTEYTYSPKFKEVEITPIVEKDDNQSTEIKESTDWVKTDDEGLVNYASSPIDNSSLWPVYKTWTLNGTSFTDKSAPNDISEVYNANAKTMMKYQTLGYDSWNRQGHLSRQTEAYTGNHYIRMIDGRMLIALGQYYSKMIGTYIDIQLEDGTVLACILGDSKAIKDTDETNRYCIWDYSVLEFVVDSQGENSSDYSRIKSLDPIAGTGNFSNVPEFSSAVKMIRVYDKVYNIDMSDTSNDSKDINDRR